LRSDANDYAYHLYEERRSGRMSRREFLRRATIAGLSLSAASSLLAACGSDGAQEGQEQAPAGPVRRGGTARLGLIVPASDPDPVTLFSGGAQATTQVCAEALCFPRPDYSLAPMLATRWEPGAGAKEWTFTLREGVKFHDGSTMTADDVVATFDRLTNPDNESAALGTFTGILSYEQTEKIDDLTVRFNLDRPYVDFPYLLSPFNYNALILPKDYEIGTFTDGGVGTGPYVLEEYRPEQGATFVRNKDYWAKGMPYMDGVEATYYDDNSPLVLAMQGGEVDLVPQIPYQGSQALFQDPSIVVLENPSSEYRGLHMRVDKKPFDDKRVRQALALCVDRPELVKGLFEGRAVVGNDHPFAPAYPDSPAGTAVPQRERDIAKAKKLLSDAGHSGGIEVELTTERFLEIPQYAVTLKEQAKAAGIDIKLNILPQTEYYGSGDNQPWLEVPLGLVDWASRGSASQTIAPAYLCDGIWNAARWCNEEYDDLVLQFDGALDEQRRKQLATKAAKLQQEETPGIIAYWTEELRVVKNNVAGLAKGPNIVLDMSPVWTSG
jgi:peptide/nickel transport system substrate-binding protein